MDDFGSLWTTLTRTRLPVEMYCTLPASTIVLALVFWPQAVYAQAQGDAPPDIVIPSSPSAEEMNRAKQKIAEFLQKNKSAGPVRSSGDPMLDDVLDVIRRRGSVLDGSALDPNRPLETSTPTIAADETSRLIVRPGEAAYLTAEHLLKAARSLQKLQHRDADDAELARLLRRRAAKLMIEAISEESAAVDARWQGGPMQDAAP